jgi:hypothetical protein
MYHRDGGVRLEVFVSDTGSYSEMVFGLLKLLGVDYRPELANTSSTAAKASCARHITPGWKISSTRWAWSPIASPVEHPLP